MPGRTDGSGGGLATSRALTLGLDGRADDGEADATGGGGKRFGEGVILDFGDATTIPADQELRRLVTRMRVRLALHLDAADEGGQAFEAVHQPLLLQEIQCAVDGGWSAAATAGAQAVQQVIGAERTFGVEDEAQHIAPQIGQSGPTPFPQRGRPVQQVCRSG